jgi:hypothetical protein
MSMASMFLDLQLGLPYKRNGDGNVSQPMRRVCPILNLLLQLWQLAE